MGCLIFFIVLFALVIKGIKFAFFMFLLMLLLSIIITY